MGWGWERGKGGGYAVTSLENHLAEVPERNRSQYRVSFFPPRNGGEGPYKFVQKGANRCAPALSCRPNILDVLSPNIGRIPSMCGY